MKAKSLFAASLVLLSVSTASAHYLWVTIDGKAGDNGTTNIYFEGGPSAGDGQYLDPFIDRGKTWIRTASDAKPKPLKVADTKKGDKRWLSAKLTQSGPRSIDSYAMWGVYRYGKTDVLLHYYARHLDVSNHDELHELARAEQMKLDIVAHDDGGEMELTVLWDGKPAASRQIRVRGPKGFKENLKTDDSGRASFKIGDAKGRYTFYTNVEEKKSGKQDGKDYQLVRHHGTLIMQLPLE